MQLAKKGAIKTFSIWDLESRIADLGMGLRLDKEGSPKTGLEACALTLSLRDVPLPKGEEKGSPKTGLAQINEKGDHKNPSFAKRDRGWRAFPIILFAFRMSYANCRIV